MPRKHDNTRHHADSNADEVMLNPDYLRKIRNMAHGDNHETYRLTNEDMDSIFDSKDIFEKIINSYLSPKKGFSAHAVFSMKEVIDKRGRRRIVPFIGIEGTF